MKKILILAILLIPIVLVAGVWYAGNSLTLPVNVGVGVCPKDLNCENVEFLSDSGAKIKGWFVEGQKGKGVIVLMHGVRGNRSQMIERVKFLQEGGFSVLAFDFQAHGESIGEQITFGYLERKDSEAAIEFVKKRLLEEKIGVVGISMGGAAFVLSENKTKADAVILEMVYPTMQSAIENRLNLWLFNGADWLTPLMSYQFRPRLGISVDELRPIDKLKELKSPILFIIAENDVHTLMEDSKQLFDAGNEPKEMWVVPKAKHQDLYKFSAKDYKEKIISFFENNLK